MVRRFVRSVVAFWFAAPRTAADTASLATWFLFGKLFGVAMLVCFGEKRCRKTLPLRDLDFSDVYRWLS